MITAEVTSLNADEGVAAALKAAGEGERSI